VRGAFLRPGLELGDAGGDAAGRVRGDAAADAAGLVRGARCAEERDRFAEDGDRFRFAGADLARFCPPDENEGFSGFLGGDLVLDFDLRFCAERDLLRFFLPGEERFLEPAFDLDADLLSLSEADVARFFFPEAERPLDADVDFARLRLPDRDLSFFLLGEAERFLDGERSFFLLGEAERFLDGERSLRQVDARPRDGSVSGAASALFCFCLSLSELCLLSSAFVFASGWTLARSAAAAASSCCRCSAAASAAVASSFWSFGLLSSPFWGCVGASSERLAASSPCRPSAFPSPPLPAGEEPPADFLPPRSWMILRSSFSVFWRSSIFRCMSSILSWNSFRMSWIKRHMYSDADVRAELSSSS